MLGSLLALVHAHKQCLTVDKEAIETYDSKLKEERKRADDQVRFTFKLYDSCNYQIIYYFHTTDISCRTISTFYSY